MDRPETRELECFVAVAEELSFMRAARRIHLSQPPLSRHIQKLEAKLGARLLIRSTRRVELTAQGAAFLEDARFLLRHLDRALDTVRRGAVEDFQVLNVGFVGAILETGLIEVLRRFRGRNAGWQVRLHDMHGPDLITALDDRLIDGAFIGTRPTTLPRTLAMTTWKREPLMVALPAEHALARHERIDLRLLAEENWVLIERSAAPAFHRRLLQLCAEAGFRPRVIQESDRIPALLAMVAMGEAVGLFNQTSIRSMRHVAYRPLGPREISFEQVFVHRRGDDSVALQALLNDLRRGRTIRQ